ncbi:ACRO protein, partial [Cisticola juncidis]|nr:ACRO protein [Cisticola juncidis]
HMCSGALVTRRWVLATARCFIGAGDIHKWRVVLGATDLAQPGPEAEVFQIRRLLRHRHYHEDTESNNIALLELEQPVECSDYIQLGCVPDSALAVPELRTCYMAGWRAAPDSGIGSKREAPTLSCSQVFVPGVLQGERGRAQRDGVCSQLLPGWGKLAPQPVGSEREGRVNWGKGCAGAKRPGIFTSTQHFHGWIRAHAG